MVSTMFSTEGPLIIGHRGASGLALENSFSAFELAADASGNGRCDGVELDVHVSADGQLIVHHDPDLHGTPISQLTRGQIGERRLPDGSSVPRLDEAMEILAEMLVFVETKTLPVSADAALLELLRHHGLGHCGVHAFDHRIVARLKEGEPDLKTGVLSCSYPVDPVRQAAEAGATTLWQESHLIDADLINRCHAADIGVIAWTVNERAEAGRLRLLGIDGLCGNWPERLR